VPSQIELCVDSPKISLEFGKLLTKMFTHIGCNVFNQVIACLMGPFSETKVNKIWEALVPNPSSTRHTASQTYNQQCKKFCNLLDIYKLEICTWCCNMSQPKDTELCCDFLSQLSTNRQNFTIKRAFGDDDTFHLSRHVKWQCYISI
jgi:hypothetical protein